MFDSPVEETIMAIAGGSAKCEHLGEEHITVTLHVLATALCAHATRSRALAEMLYNPATVEEYPVLCDSLGSFESSLADVSTLVRSLMSEIALQAVDSSAPGAADSVPTEVCDRNPEPTLCMPHYFDALEDVFEEQGLQLKLDAAWTRTPKRNTDPEDGTNLARLTPCTKSTITPSPGLLALTPELQQRETTGALQLECSSVSLEVEGLTSGQLESSSLPSTPQRSPKAWSDLTAAAAAAREALAASVPRAFGEPRRILRVEESDNVVIGSASTLRRSIDDAGAKPDRSALEVTEEERHVPCVDGSPSREADGSSRGSSQRSETRSGGDVSLLSAPPPADSLCPPRPQSMVLLTPVRKLPLNLLELPASESHVKSNGPEVACLPDHPQDRVGWNGAWRTAH